MKRHVASVHEERKTFKCDICDFSWAERNVLKVHVVSVHEGDKPSNCDICNNCVLVSWVMLEPMDRRRSLIILCRYVLDKISKILTPFII